MDGAHPERRSPSGGKEEPIWRSSGRAKERRVPVSVSVSVCVTCLVTRHVMYVCVTCLVTRHVIFPFKLKGKRGADGDTEEGRERGDAGAETGGASLRPSFPSRSAGPGDHLVTTSTSPF